MKCTPTLLFFVAITIPVTYGNDDPVDAISQLETKHSRLGKPIPLINADLVVLYTTCVHKVVYITCDFSFMNTFCITS